MQKTRSKFSRWLKKGVLLAPLVIVLAVLLNGFVEEPVFATQSKTAALATGKDLGGPESRAGGSATLYRSRTLFQSPLPTSTFTPTPVPPTDTPTPEPPTYTPTPEPPTYTPTPEPPTDTPTPEPPTDTPVPNQPPEITSLTVPLDPVAFDGQPVAAEARFSDANAGDTHQAHWSWGDSTGSTCPPNTIDCIIDQNNDTIRGSHTYAEPGVYQIVVSVTDEGGLSDTERSGFVVIYDRGAGFVSGGGWISSEAGWCKLDHCASADGKATFGFVSKYKKGASVPGGNTQFNFLAGDLNFHSTTYQWLVVNQGVGTAQFKGTGTINGEMAPGGVPYQFMLWASDDSPDTFRIKISYETPPTEVVVYDPGSRQSLGGGSIVIHDDN